MSQPTAIEFCAGFGGWTALVKDWLRPVCALELDPALAATYAANHPGALMIVGDMAAQDMVPLPAATVGLFSQPCKNFSEANHGAEETEADRALAHALPATPTVAMTGIGNMVPPVLARALVGPLLETLA